MLSSREYLIILNHSYSILSRAFFEHTENIYFLPTSREDFEHTEKNIYLLQVENVLTYWMNIFQNLGLKCFVLPTFHSNLISLCKAEAAPNVLHSVYYSIFSLKHPAILTNIKKGWKIFFATTTLAYCTKDYTWIKSAY